MAKAKIRMPVKKSKGRFKIGNTITTNASGPNVIDSKTRNFETVTGYVGEINSSHFYIWQNDASGSQGNINSSTKGFKYSWKVSFDGFDKCWVEIEVETTYIKIISDDLFDDRLLMENSDVLRLLDVSAIDGRPVFEIVNEDKWDKIKIEIEKIGQINYIPELHKEL